LNVLVSHGRFEGDSFGFSCKFVQSKGSIRTKVWSALS
jgi:hypothetical protein